MMKVWLSVCLCALLSACSGNGDSLKWTEDVLLPDGRVVTLTRYQEFKGPHEFGREPTESDYWLEFRNPDTGEIIRWQYGRDLGTVALLIDKSAPLLLVKPRWGSSRRDFDCPDPPYFLYRYENSTWKRIDLKELPIKRIKSNVTYAVSDRQADIARGKYRLSVQHTQSAFVLNMQPWVMDFSNMREQTFGHMNCAKQSNYLLVKP